MMLLRTKHEGDENHEKFYFNALMPDGTKYGEVVLETLCDTCHLHVQISKWTPSTAKMMKIDYSNDVVHQVRKLGKSKIVVSFSKNVGDGDVEKWKKFIHMVGFPEPESYYVSTMEV